MTKLTRRDFLRASTAATGMGLLGESFTNFRQMARAADGDEHFFLFIELRGGVCWPFATDARDLSQLPMENGAVVKPLELKPDGSQAPLTAEQRTEILGSPAATMLHGNLIILPFVESLENSYRRGKTKLGADWRLGIAGGPLAPYVDEIAVVRGVRSLHNFHGGANDEAFCGVFNDRPDQPRKHVAAALAAALAPKLGPKLLDNLVLERATFAATGNDVSRPMRIDVRTLGMLATGQGGTPFKPEVAERRFQRAKALANGVGNAQSLGKVHRDAFGAYLSSMDKAPVLQRRLSEISSRLSNADASLDLDLQVDTALTLFESGLSRVATLCLGADNKMNNVDGFGLFDAHYGMLHKSDSGFARKTYGHYLNVQNAMTSLARLITELKTRQYNGKTLWDSTTVVVTSEFSRPTNSNGNEDFQGRFGSGHYNFNNNYLLFGKGVRGGAWIGQNDPVTQYSHLAKMETLSQPDPTAVQYSVPETFKLNAKGEAYVVEAGGSVEGMPAEPGIGWVGGANRPIMPKDVLATAFRIADQEAKFRSVYSGKWFSDARALVPVTG